MCYVLSWLQDIYMPCINGGMSPEDAKKHARRRIPNQLAGPAECIDGIAAGTYLNTKAVQQAINVASAAQYYGEWTM